MNIRVAIVGIGGFGGGGAMRLVARPPSFELVYAAGEGSAGSRLVERFPSVPAKLAELVIEKWDPATLPTLDVLFVSLPTGAPRSVDGWTYGLADVWPPQIEGRTRVANPGCFPAAPLNALAPLLASKLIEPGNIVIDAKTGISGAGRGNGESKFGYAESNENLVPYGRLKHVHAPEIARTIERLSGGSAEGLVFSPHLVPMTRGILATIYCRGRATTEQCLDAARRFYEGRAFVRVTAKPPHTKWATGSDLSCTSSAAHPERHLVIEMGVVDNLGKGAAGQAVQNANLICGLPEASGLDGAAIWP